jgi:hypothetical protein
VEVTLKHEGDNVREFYWAIPPDSQTARPWLVMWE